MSKPNETYLTKYSDEGPKEIQTSEFSTESTGRKQKEGSCTSNENPENSIEILLGQQDKKRKKYLLFFSIIFIVISILAIFTNITPDFSKILFRILPCLCIATYAGYKITGKSNSEFYKKNILPIIIGQATEGRDNLEGKITFDIGSQVKGSDVSVYNNTGLFSYCNKVWAEDIFLGKMNKTDFTFSEVSLEHKSGKSSSSVFLGINIRIQYNDIIASRTLLNMETSLFGDPYKTIKTNDRKFNELYTVYSNDFEGTSQTLTAEFKDKLMKLYHMAEDLREDSTDDSIKILLNLNVLDIYIPCKIDLFEASFFTKMTSEKVEKDKHRINTILDLIDMFTTNVNYLKFEG